MAHTKHNVFDGVMRSPYLHVTKNVSDPTVDLWIVSMDAPVFKLWNRMVRESAIESGQGRGPISQPNRS